MNFRRAYRICRYEKPAPNALRSIDNVDPQLHFLSLVMRLVGH
jgi:hypothetical protein